MNFIISVGRNIGSTPMDIRRWQECQTAVLNAAQTAAMAIYFRGCGSGAYLYTPEESFTVIGELRGVGPIAAMVVNELRQDLAFIASRYEQESIALTFGEPEFIHP